MTGKRRVRDWQATDPHLREHPYFKRLVRRLDVSPVMAHGLLSGLWAFGFRFAHDGDVSRFSAEDIAIAAGWEGDPDAMMDALTCSGFIENGVLHHWHEWGGRLFAERDAEAGGRWERRNRTKQEKVSGDVRGQTRTIPDNAPEERRVEKKRVNPPPSTEQKADPPSKSKEKITAPKVDEWATRATALIEASAFPSDLLQLAEIMAAENATGRVALSRVVRELYQPLVDMESQFTAEAMRYGLRCAVSSQAPNANYVKKAAAKFRPNGNGSSGNAQSSMDVLKQVYDGFEGEA